MNINKIILKLPARITSQLTLMLLTTATVAFIQNEQALQWNHSPDLWVLATHGYGLLLLLMWISRFFHRDTLRMERALGALFLAIMPWVYALGNAWNPKIPLPILLLELSAIPFYGFLAWQGWSKSYLILAGGIVAHGLIWDLVHLITLRHVVPDWYSQTCLTADLLLGIYFWLRLRLCQDQTVI